jgi:PhzF family phenazine biosynthesis protein
VTGGGTCHDRGMELLVVDAFAAEPFRGNPAGVCFLDGEHTDAWMASVAAELKHAETAFLVTRDDGGYGLRWFTPETEVALCGHATLASAHVLWETGQLAPTETARFHTRSGVLTATRRDDWIDLDFPVTPDEPVDPPPPGLVEALGVHPLYVGKSRFDYLVQVADEATLRAVQPDFTRLRTMPGRGVIVTSRGARAEVDFVSRFFAPQSGIDEDPVTGSSHCCLAYYWSRQLGKDRFLAHQISPRGGVLQVRLNGDRVQLGGQAVTVLRGDLLA